jgi:hypothetical protein
MNTGLFYTTLGIFDMVPYPRRLGYPDKPTVVSSDEVTRNLERHADGPLRKVDFFPTQGCISGAHDRSEIVDPNGIRWRTVEGRWVLWLNWYNGDRS